MSVVEMVLEKRVNKIVVKIMCDFCFISVKSNTECCVYREAIRRVLCKIGSVVCI